MMKTCLGWALVSVISITVLGCSGVASPLWNGTWKLNQSKSSIPGPDFSIAILPVGEYLYDNGTYSYKFFCDGKEYPARLGHTISCLQTSASAIETTHIDNGTKVGLAHWELSADGKMLTIKGTSIQADGSAKPTEQVFSRTSESIGFAGGWRNTKRLESRPTMLLTLNERSLHMAFSGTGEYVDVPLDGSDAPMHGPGMPQELTLAVKVIGPREFLTLKKFGGKLANEGSLKLTTDGRTLIEEYWNPKRPERKATLVYDRQ
jgi:hypothetical protein